MLTQTCLSSKLVQTTRLRGDCQPIAITGFPLVFHSPAERSQLNIFVIPDGFSREESAFRSFQHATKRIFLSAVAHAPMPFSGSSRDGRRLV